MNENYVENVRKSLYGRNESEKKSKINYKSGDLVSLPRPQTKTKKTSKRESSFSDDSFQDVTKYEEKLKKKLKKGTKHSPIYPSQSEQFDLSALQKKRFSNKKLWPKRSEEFEESDIYFNLNEFFNSKEQSFNESFTESHSGIEYEFLSDDASKAKIKSSRIYEDKNVPVIDDKAALTYAIDQTSDEAELTCAIHQISDEDVEENSIGINVSMLDNAMTEISFESKPIEIEPSPRWNGDVIEISSEEIICPNTESQINSKPETFQQKNNSYKSFDLGSQKLVILKEDCSLPLFGLCSLKVLHGKLEILGCTLHDWSKEVNVYSPRGSSLLVARNITPNNVNCSFSAVKPILNSNEKLKKIELENTSVIFICSKLEDCRIKFLEKYISQQIFPKIAASRAPQIIFDPKDKFNIVATNEEWENALKNVDCSTKMLIAGGKGVGKSTFLRYSINSLLNRFKNVRIIDLDPGQSEFSVPGSISVLTISDPILGPNYTHMQRTQRSYLSNINVGHEPKKYLELIKFLVESLDVGGNAPTLINYMGFATGIGINIISSAITILRPTDIIQIESKSHKKNFKTDLTERTVKENCRLFGGNLKRPFRLRKIFSMTDDNAGWSLEARLAREMCILSYFGEMMKNGAESLTSHNLPMYKIDFNSIKITDTDGKTLPPAAINGSVVALCSQSEGSQIFNVLGHALVRGIDPQDEKIVLTTPEPLDILENVFYLVSSSIALPTSVYMSTDGITGPIPYVMEGELEALGQITRRSYIPASKK